MKFEKHPDVRRYEDSIILAVETRTGRIVMGISMEGNTLTVTLDQAPTASEQSAVDDILAATERYPDTVNGATVTYALQAVDPDNPDLPDRHLTFDERIKQLVGDVGDLGKNVGAVAPADVTPDTTGHVVDVQLPASASETAKQRTQEAMLAFGRVKQS